MSHRAEKDVYHVESLCTACSCQEASLFGLAFEPRGEARSAAAALRQGPNQKVDSCGSREVGSGFLHLEQAVTSATDEDLGREQKFFFFRLREKEILAVTSASLVVTSALLVVTRS